MLVQAMHMKLVFSFILMHLHRDFDATLPHVVGKGHQIYMLHLGQAQL